MATLGLIKSVIVFNLNYYETIKILKILNIYI